MAIKEGHKIELICFEFNNWSKVYNNTLLQELGNIKIIKLAAGHTPFLQWGYSLITEKIFRFIGQYLSLRSSLLSQSISRRSFILVSALNKITKPDLVIGHNQGAMWPTLFAAQKFNCKAGFDVEDYHAGEGDNLKLQNLTKQLMIRLLPKFNYVSFAAPLILQQTKAHFGNLNFPWFTVLNYFPKNEFISSIETSTGVMKMVWFSQNINKDRGIELIIDYVKKSKSRVELHLIGNLNTEFNDKYLKGISNIIIHPPMEQKNLHQLLSTFDIGLALDLPVDVNRNLVITNKLLAYLQAGLYVVATNTSAQIDLIDDWPDHGVCFDYLNNNSEEIFDGVVEKLSIIRKNKTTRYTKFSENNWENTALQLLIKWVP